jgi:hypothetical protein
MAGLRVALPHQVDDIHLQFLRQVGEGAHLLVAGGPDGDRPIVKFGLRHDARSIRAPLASNGITTATASSAVPLRTMAHQLDNSLEALSNLLYLLSRSLDDPAQAEAYFDVADKVLNDIADRRIAPPGSIDGMP